MLRFSLTTQHEWGECQVVHLLVCYIWEWYRIITPTTSNKGALVACITRSICGHLFHALRFNLLAFAVPVASKCSEHGSHLCNLKACIDSFNTNLISLQWFLYRLVQRWLSIAVYIWLLSLHLFDDCYMLKVIIEKVLPKILQHWLIESLALYSRLTHSINISPIE